MSIEVEVFTSIGTLQISPATVTNYHFTQRFTDSKGVLEIPLYEMKRLCDPSVPCYLHASTLAWSPTKYSLNIETNDAYLQSIALDDDNKSHKYDIMMGQYIHFNQWVPKNAAAVSVALEPLSGDQDIYVSFAATLDEYPDRKNHQYRSNAWGNASENIRAYRGDKLHFCSNCYMLVSVYGYATGSFYITVTTELEQRLGSSHPLPPVYSPLAYIGLILAALSCIGVTVLLMMQYESTVKNCMAPREHKWRPVPVDEGDCSTTSYRAPTLDVSREELMHFIALAEASDAKDNSPFFR